jgi:hypothetical protein
LAVTNPTNSASSQVASLLLEPRPAFNGNGAGWMLNANAGVLAISNNVLTLSDGFGNEARSAFFIYPMYIGGFTASFTYQDVNGGSTNADGATFCLQNTALGAAALGSVGGQLGYGGLSNSVAVELNLYNPNTMGIAIRTNGATGGPYNSTLPLSLTSGDPINVTITYAKGILSVALADPTAGTSYATNLTINIPAACGGSTAWVGLTGGTGGSVSTQTVSNFVFAPLPILSAQAGVGPTVVLSWPGSVGGFNLQSTSGLLPPNWQPDPATVTLVNGQYQATVSSTPISKFYRLVLP